MAIADLMKQQQNAAAPKNFFDQLGATMQSPLFTMGASVMGAPNIGQGLMQGAQTSQQLGMNRMKMAELEQRQGDQARQREIWGRLFGPDGPDTAHPLLKNLPPEMMSIAQAMGPEQGLAALQKFALTRATPPELQLKTVGDQGVVFNPRDGSHQVLPGLTGAGGQGKPPPGYRWAGDGRLEAIPGGPATKVPAEAAGRLAMMETAMPAVEEARKVFLKPWGVTGAVGQAVMPEQLSTWSGEVGRARRSVRTAIEAALRVMTGAAAPETEVVRYEDLFMPKATDTKETAAQKLNALNDFMVNAREISTRGRRQQGAAPPAGGQQQSNDNDPLGIR